MSEDLGAMVRSTRLLPTSALLRLRTCMFRLTLRV